MKQEKVKNKRKSPVKILGEYLISRIRNFDRSKISVPIPKVALNFYLISTVIFVIWMLFFDSNDVISQYERRSRLKDLEKEKKFYVQGIQDIEEKREKLSKNVKILERFARENYFLKKPSEDVYIIEYEQDSTVLQEAAIIDTLSK